MAICFHTRCERHGLRELKPTRTILWLAACSTRYPRDILEDDVVKVGKFIFFIDFVVLQIESATNPDAKIQVILS